MEFSRLKALSLCTSKVFGSHDSQNVSWITHFCWMPMLDWMLKKGHDQLALTKALMKSEGRLNPWFILVDPVSFGKIPSIPSTQCKIPHCIVIYIMIYIYILIFGTHIDVFAGMKSYVNDLQLWSLRHKKVLLEDEFSPVRGAFKGSVQNGLLNLCCFGRTATSRIWTNNKNPGMHQFFDTFHWWFPYMSLWFPMSILLVTSKILFIKFELFRWSNPHFNMSK